ncbi:MAG TPA: hypothetical protein VFT22_15305, partial [Kofleriaceae bacterium]|nr:hypothetical protein [Kofleriaceae bacterium]
MLNEADNDDDEPAKHAEAALEVDDFEEVEDIPAIPPPRATLAFRSAAPTPPPLPARPPGGVPGVPVVMVPPRPPAPIAKVPPLGSRPPLVPRASAPMAAVPMAPPSVAIPPRESDGARSEPVRVDAARHEPPRGELLEAERPSEPVKNGEPAREARDAGSSIGSDEPTPIPGALPSLPSLPSPPAPPLLASVPPLPRPPERRKRHTTVPPLGDSVERIMDVMSARDASDAGHASDADASDAGDAPGQDEADVAGAISPSISPSDTATLSAGGVEVSTGVATHVAVDQPLEAHLESPTVLDRALEELGDAGGEKRAEAMARELEATSDPAVAAMLAYELGELYERRLADEARAVKAFGKALALDPGLRANLWAIRRVFYRRALWPNLVKLIAAEVGYARDDHERADLLLEKARIAGQHMQDPGEARAALEEATRIAPQHQAALLELERLLAHGDDLPALLDVWERLADAVESPARKIAYWLEVARAAAPSDFGRAQAAFDQAAVLAPDDRLTAERIARERLHAAEAHGTPGEVASAIEALAGQLVQAFGPAGAELTEGDGRPERAQRMRRELVALRRRQAQLARTDAPERAWDVLQQAIAMSPGDPLLLSDLTELAEELGRYDALADLVQSWQAVEGDPGRAMALSIRRADALLRGGQRDQARALLASLEATAPGFIVLTSVAERDALGRGDGSALANTYLSAAHAALLGSWVGPGQQPIPDPTAAAALYVQAAEILAYEVGGPDAIEEARGALGRALEAVPEYPVALEALTELDDTTGNVAEGLARLRAQASAADGDTRRQLIERAIRLARSHGDLDSVLALETELVQLSPSELALRWRLEATLGQLGRDDERAQLLAELATLESDAMRRGTALLAAARLRERGGAVEQATELYRQVLTLWPEDTFARESLIDLLRAQEKWTELVTERRAEARAMPDGPAARRALREAAWVLEIRLGDTASAAQVYDEWLIRAPEDRTALE